MDFLPFKRMSKSSYSSMPKIPCEIKKAYKTRLGYRKQCEVQHFLCVLYRRFFCKLGQLCIPCKEGLKESFSIEVL